MKKHERTRDVLLLATDAARLDREFVAEKVNDSLALLGADLIKIDDTNDDAGDE